MAVLVPEADVDPAVVGVVVVADSGGTEVPGIVVEVVRDAMIVVVSLGEEETDDDEDAWFLDKPPAMPPPTPAPMITIEPMANAQKTRGASPHIRSRWRFP